MRALVILAVVLAPGIAAADTENWLAGPLLGVRLGAGPGSALVFGVEGGLGVGPERFNLGFEHRSQKMFYYGEIDPWYVLGGTFGFGADEDGEVHPVLGVWEGLPILPKNLPCSGWFNLVTLSGGYRYTGVHELYLSVKAGRMNGSICFNE
jgi:hypothetical protein